MDQLDAIDIQLAHTEEVTQREIEAWRLIVHPVYELQGAHGAGGIKPTGIDDGKTQRGGCQVDPFEVTESVVKTDGGRFFYGDGIELLHGQRGGFLFLIDALTADNGFADDESALFQAHIEPCTGGRHHNLEGCIAGVGKFKDCREGGHGDREGAVVAGDPTPGGAQDRDSGTDEFFTGFRISDLAPDDSVLSRQHTDRPEDGHTKKGGSRNQGDDHMQDIEQVKQ